MLRRRLLRRQWSAHLSRDTAGRREGAGDPAARAPGGRSPRLSGPSFGCWAGGDTRSLVDRLAGSPCSPGRDAPERSRTAPWTEKPRGGSVLRSLGRHRGHGQHASARQAGAVRRLRRAVRRDTLGWRGSDGSWLVARQGPLWCSGCATHSRAAPTVQPRGGYRMDVRGACSADVANHRQTSVRNRQC
jgi:hypothetical protein